MMRLKRNEIIFHFNTIINKWFSSTDHSFSLGFFRISTALISWYNIYAIRKDFKLFYTKSAIIPNDLATLYNPSYLISVDQIVKTLTSYFRISDQEALDLIFGFFTLCCILLLLGILKYFSSLFILLLHLIFIKSIPLFSYGVDYFISMSLFYCLIFPVDKSLSLKRKFAKNKPFSNYYRRILQIHICIVYLSSGLGKFLGNNWWNGEAIWKTINLPSSNVSLNKIFISLCSNSYVYLICGLFVLFLELFYPIFIFINKTRSFYLHLVVLMHVAIAISLNLYTFSAIMITWNISAFYFNEDNYIIPVCKSMI